MIRNTESAPAPAGDSMLRARYCPLCGAQFAVLKGHPNPWSPDIKRNQLDGYEALLAERDRLRAALERLLGDMSNESLDQARAALAEGGK